MKEDSGVYGLEEIDFDPEETTQDAHSSRQCSLALGCGQGAALEYRENSHYPIIKLVSAVKLLSKPKRCRRIRAADPPAGPVNGGLRRFHFLSAMGT
ncbi:MAG: hypothetical protein R6V25_03110 [Desulfatiglandales bacterium]